MRKWKEDPPPYISRSCKQDSFKFFKIINDKTSQDQNLTVVIFNIQYHWTIFWIMYSKTFILVIGVVLCWTRSTKTKFIKFISFGQCPLRKIDYSLFYVRNHLICFIHSKQNWKFLKAVCSLMYCLSVALSEHGSIQI